MSTKTIKNGPLQTKMIRVDDHTQYMFQRVNGILIGINKKG
jgi:hypothetical protein